MFVYALTEPIDIFDGLTPLPEWIIADPARRTRWALQAVLALADTATQVRWNGDMRHLPSVGATLTPPATSPYLVVKQDNNGTTFIVADVELPCPQTLSNTAPKSTSGPSAPGPTPPSPRSTPRPPATSASTRRLPLRSSMSVTHPSDPYPASTKKPAAFRCRPSGYRLISRDRYTSLPEPIGRPGSDRTEQS